MRGDSEGDSVPEFTIRIPPKNTEETRLNVSGVHKEGQKNVRTK